MRKRLVSAILAVIVTVSAIPLAPPQCVVGATRVIESPRITVEAVYDSATSIITISWQTLLLIELFSTPLVIRDGKFDIYYSSAENRELRHLVTLENQFSYEFITDGEDFVCYTFEVRHSEIPTRYSSPWVSVSGIYAGRDVVYWSPVGVCWTQYVRRWEISSDLIRIPTDGPFKISLIYEGAGHPDWHLSLRQSPYSNAMQSTEIRGVAIRGMIFEVFSFQPALAVESLTVKLEIADEFIENELGIFTHNPEFVGIRRFNLFTWASDVNMVLPLETRFLLSENTLYTTVTTTRMEGIVRSLGHFALVDMEVWFNAWGITADDLPVPESPLQMTLGNGVINLHNPTDTAVSARGLYFICDNDLLKWQMPAVIIRAGETAQIRINSDNVTPVLKHMTTNFDLSDGKFRLVRFTNNPRERTIADTFAILRRFAELPSVLDEREQY
jgi:hypothetical protein